MTAKDFNMVNCEQKTITESHPSTETTNMASVTSSLSTSKQESPLYRIGYWWSDKKSQKLNISELEALLADNKCQLVKIPLDRSIEDVGPFAVVIHKLSDIVVKADQGDQNARRAIQIFEKYVAKHPETTILDPLTNVRALLDRGNQYRLIEESGLAKADGIFTPPFVHLTSTNVDVNRGRIKRSSVKFPIVCKPLLAHGSTAAHQMSLIFNEAGLKDVKPPCVAQTFINHNARLFKLFVIKHKYYVIERPSLKNFQAGDYETVFFYTHDISKPNSSSELTELDEKDRRNVDQIEGADADASNGLTGGDFNAQLPCPERLKRIVKVFTEKLGLALFGIDIIIENGTGRYAIIDMNAFPGYDGVENFLKLLTDVIVGSIRCLDENDPSSLTKVKRLTIDPDSGIEST